MNHDYFKAKNTFSHTLLEYKVGFDLPTWSWEQVEENTLYYSITDGFYMQVFKYRKIKKNIYIYVVIYVGPTLFSSIAF